MRWNEIERNLEKTCEYPLNEEGLTLTGSLLNYIMNF